MNKLEVLKTIFDKAHENYIKIQNIKVFGYQYNYETTICKSLSKFGFFDNTIIEMIAPKNSESENNNRPGTLLETVEYITIHDTASAAPTANELAHATYVFKGGSGTSWHYSIGDKEIYHQLPDNEVGYHAGDGTKVRFELMTTNVLATNKEPAIDIKDGYYSLNGHITNIRVPSNEQKLILDKKDINDAGIRIDIDENGYYQIGTTYFSEGYKKISNRGGNNNSIGIETMVHKTSDLMKTWHITAKHVAKLLKDNNLEVSRVKPHHFFSGKNCPMTMRENKMWDYFLECVKIEYEILTFKNDYEIILSHDSDMVDEKGFIIIDKIHPGTINYQITIKNNKEKLVLNYQTIVK